MCRGVRKRFAAKRGKRVHARQRAELLSAANEASKRVVLAANMARVEQDGLRGVARGAHQDEMAPTAQPPPLLHAQQWLAGQHRRGAAMSNLDELDNLDETTPVAQRWLSSFLERFELADSQASPGNTLDRELASSASGMLTSNPRLARRSLVDPEGGMAVAPGMLPTPSTPTHAVPQWVSECDEETRV